MSSGPSAESRVAYCLAALRTPLMRLRASSCVGAIHAAEGRAVTRPAVRADARGGRATASSGPGCGALSPGRTGVRSWHHRARLPPRHMTPARRALHALSGCSWRATLCDAAAECRTSDAQSSSALVKTRLTRASIASAAARAPDPLLSGVLDAPLGSTLAQAARSCQDGDWL